MITAYIAGPFRAPTDEGVRENIRAAERVGLVVAKVGGNPLIPHANTGSFHGVAGIPEQFWLDATMELMRRCDVVILTPDWQKSSGARAERAEAEKLSIPVHVYGVDTGNGIVWPTLADSADEPDTVKAIAKLQADLDEAQARLVDFLTSTAPGGAQRSRYAGDKLRAFLSNARRALSMSIAGRRLNDEGTASVMSLTLNPHLIPSAPSTSKDRPDSAG